MFWDADIHTAKESKKEKLTEERDGNYKSDSGTYGQSDYTVRERDDGTYDLYIKSDSNKGHSHDHIDKDGNLLDRYHDYLYYEVICEEKNMSLKLIR